jgi:hypothetical protein
LRSPAPASASPARVAEHHEATFDPTAGQLDGEDVIGHARHRQGPNLGVKGPPVLELQPARSSVFADERLQADALHRDAAEPVANRANQAGDCESEEEGDDPGRCGGERATTAARAAAPPAARRAHSKATAGIAIARSRRARPSRNKSEPGPSSIASLRMWSASEAASEQLAPAPWGPRCVPAGRRRGSRC